MKKVAEYATGRVRQFSCKLQQIQQLLQPAIIQKSVRSTREGPQKAANQSNATETLFALNQIDPSNPA